MLVKYATSTYEIFKGVGTNLSKVTNEPKYFRFDPNDHFGRSPSKRRLVWCVECSCVLIVFLFKGTILSNQNKISKRKKLNIY